MMRINVSLISEASLEINIVKIIKEDRRECFLFFLHFIIHILQNYISVRSTSKYFLEYYAARPLRV